MVYRVYVEKKAGLDGEARSLASDLRTLLKIDGIKTLRVLNRYDVENIDEKLFDYSVGAVFSEPQLDNVSYTAPTGDIVFAVEPLPGQYDQRADSAAQCIQIISCGERPTVRTAKVYVVNGELTEEEIAAVKKYVINPVECREASLETVKTLKADFDVPADVAVLEGFLSLDRESAAKFVAAYGLAMDTDDLLFCRDYFKSEQREPTLT